MVCSRRKGGIECVCDQASAVDSFKTSGRASVPLAAACHLHTAAHVAPAGMRHCPCGPCRYEAFLKKQTGEFQANTQRKMPAPGFCVLLRLRDRTPLFVNLCSHQNMKGPGSTPDGSVPLAVGVPRKVRPFVLLPQASSSGLDGWPQFERCEAGRLQSCPPGLHSTACQWPPCACCRRVQPAKKLKSDPLWRE